MRSPFHEDCLSNFERPLQVIKVDVAVGKSVEVPETKPLRSLYAVVLKLSVSQPIDCVRQA